MDRIGDLDEGSIARAKTPTIKQGMREKLIKSQAKMGDPNYFQELFKKGDFDPLPWSDFFD